MTHTTPSRHTGEAGSAVGGVCSGPVCEVLVPDPESDPESDGGGVVLGAAAGPWLSWDVPAGAEVVCGVARGVAWCRGGAAVVVAGRGLVGAAVGVPATVGFRSAEPLDERLSWCREGWPSGSFEDALVFTARGVSASVGSGAAAAWACSVAGLFCRRLVVRPPPTRARAVAAAARRRYFFQRACCRRRAARPSPSVAAPSWSPAVPVPSASASDAPDPASPSGA
ncbi:hypothetical protein EST54_18155 [Streptomyces sioyaensis]|uniref:Uncharacterized protein n=1 Tax=Streptomyces sioyaensis TaxID=67364 RepID=A0A4V1NPQ3_9ACTN|nr:hypothetical protein EST54_18155 [Streptomyces sioyaensis]